MQILIRAITAKQAAQVISVVTAAILILRVYLTTVEFGSIFSALSYLSQFFTILTNILVMLTMFVIGLGRKIPRAGTELVPGAIIGVGIAYHALLAHLWSPQGLVLIADQGVHTVVPVLMLLWWLAFGHQSSMLRWKDSFLFIIWPLVYCGYALVRAEFSDFYPYPFLNVTNIGWDGLVKNVAGLTFTFFIIGLLVVLIERLRFSVKR